MTVRQKKMPDSPTKSEALAGAAEEAPNKVDQIRGLLFGAQREEYDRRFNRLEELLVTSTAELSEVMAGQLKAQKEQSDKRFARLEESLAKSIAELNDKFTTRLSAQREEYEKRLARLEELLVDSVARLDGEKLDRATLAKLLQQIVQLSHKLNITTIEKD